MRCASRELTLEVGESIRIGDVTVRIIAIRGDEVDLALVATGTRIWCIDDEGVNGAAPS